MHPTQVGQWKRELQEQAAGLLEVKRGVRPVDPSASPDRLYAEIGRLKLAEPDPEELALLALIDEEYTRHPFYGSRKTVIHLEQMGHRVNVLSGSGG